MDRLRSLISILILSFVFFAQAPVDVGLAQGPRPRVVILNSYHQGFDWSDREIDGLLAGLRRARPDLNAVVEHLDAKHFPDHPHLERVADFLAEKYQGRPVDLVVALDNSALELALTHRARVFPGASIVFAGVNNYRPEMLGGQKDVTGLLETTDAAGTLELMLRLHPETRRVLVVHDYSPSGLASRADFNRVLPVFKERVELAFPPPASLAELLETLEGLPPRTLVLLLSYSVDSQGLSLVPAETARLICKASPAPVYALHEYRLGQGVVGGFLLGGRAHGEQAAELALRVLAGEAPSSMPVLGQARSLPMFDHHQLARFGIPPEALPPDSLVVNRPVTFLEQHRNLVLGAAAAMAVMAVWVLLLSRALARGRRAGRKLETSESRYRQLFDDASDGIMLIDDQGRIVDQNKQFGTMLGYAPEETKGMRVADLISPEDLVRQPFSMALVNEGGTLQIERTMRRKDGQYLVLEVKAKRIGPGVVQALCRDITARARADAALRESEEKYRVLFEGSAQGILTADAQTSEFVLANPAICAMLGYAEQELLGLDISRIHPPEALGLVMNEFQAMVEGRTVHSAGLPVLRKDGAVFYADITAANTTIKGRRCAVGFFTDATDRKLAEDALRRSEQRFRAIFDSAFQLTGLLSPDGTVLESNRAALDLVGAEHDQVIGRPFWETPWWGDNPRQAERLREAIAQAAGGRFVRLEVEHKKKDGSLVFIDFSLKPVHDQAGEVALLIPEGRDITDRRLMEEEVKVSRDRLKLAQSIAHIGNWELDLSTGLLWGSEEAFEIYGLKLTPSQDLPLRQVQTVPVAQDRARLDLALRGLVADGLPYEIEFQFRRVADGQLRHAHSRAELIKDAEGRPVKVVGTIQDITERKLIEQSLRLTQFSFDSASIGIFRIDGEGRILSVNNTACQSLQYTKEELLGMTVFDIDPSFPREKWPAHIASLHKLGTKTIETTHRREDGEVFPVEVIISFMNFGDEEFHLAFVQDITERKKLESEREALETQLAQAQKMEAIGTLAGGIAHDFNNILTAISGYAEMAQQRAGRAEGETSRELEQVLLAADRARNLVRQILTFSRKGEARQEPLDINDIVAKTLLMLEATIPKMVTIETKLAPDIPPLLADSSQMEQLVMNLAVNANDAMPEGGRLMIETKAVLLDEEYSRRVLDIVPGLYLQMVFSDTGHGMDQNTAQHIFDPFFTTKAVGKGTGLGLSTVYGIVKGHGGRITCYSEVGIGTVFNVYLPLKPSADLPERQEEDDWAALRLRGKETILLVDDEATLRELGAETLKGMGYQVLTAASGEAALETCRALGRQLDLVILDLGMPGMGGLKCLQEILAGDPRTRVVVASGYAASGQAKAVAALGARGFVAKPFRLAEMLRTVRRILDERPDA